MSNATHPNLLPHMGAPTMDHHRPWLSQVVSRLIQGVCSRAGTSPWHDCLGLVNCSLLDSCRSAYKMSVLLSIPSPVGVHSLGSASPPTPFSTSQEMSETAWSARALVSIILGDGVSSQLPGRIHRSGQD